MPRGDQRKVSRFARHPRSKGGEPVGSLDSNASRSRPPLPSSTRQAVSPPPPPCGKVYPADSAILQSERCGSSLASASPVASPSQRRPTHIRALGGHDRRVLASLPGQLRIAMQQHTGIHRCGRNACVSTVSATDTEADMDTDRHRSVGRQNDGPHAIAASIAQAPQTGEIGLRESSRAAPQPLPQAWAPNLQREGGMRA